MDIIPFNPEAERIADYKSLVKKFDSMKDVVADENDIAVRDFFRHEVNILGAFSKEFIFPCQGHPTEVIFGQWKAHPETGLYVRAEVSYGAALSHQSDLRGSIFSDWGYWWRPDVDSKGFLYTPSSPGIEIAEIPRAREFIDRFNRTLEGYALIASSRKPLK